LTFGGLSVITDVLIEKLPSNRGENLMTNRLYLSLILVALLCLAGWTGYAQGQRSSPVQQTSEYIVVDAYNDSGQTQRVVNQYGAQGWEYVGRRGDYYVFKRPK
jgi:hypothetical protein